MNKQLSLMSLFEVGAHRGNKSSKLNPKLKKRVYGISSGLCLINLVETKNYIDNSSDLLYKLGQKKKQILIVCTSKHLKDQVVEFSSNFDNGPMPYVDNRWLGGTLSNWSTIKKTLKTLEKLENIESNTEFFSKLARNEQLRVSREKDKIKRFFGGLVNLKTNKPGAILLLDGSNNPITIQEADTVGVPVIVLTNTGILSLPKDLNNTIVCNISSINTVKVITDYLIDSYNQGLAAGLPQPKEEVKEKVTISA